MIILQSLSQHPPYTDNKQPPVGQHSSYWPILLKQI